MAPPRLKRKRQAGRTMRSFIEEVRQRAAAALRVLLVVAVGSIVVAPDAFACVCVGDPEQPSVSEVSRRLRNDLNDALSVFIGQPVANNSLTIRLRVQHVWKGELGPEVVMGTGAEATPDGLIRSSSCDVSFAFGQTYLIFGHGKALETMKAHSCSFTGPVNLQILELLDAIVPRRAPSPSVAAKKLVAVVGSVRTPGLVSWREGLTVAEAVLLAGGAIPPIRTEFDQLGLVSSVVRWHITRVRYPALPAVALLPDDEVFVAGDMHRR
jgi:hypothetical protein